MRVLVTGFAGYVGPVVVSHLKRAGHEVTGLDVGWFLGDYASLPDWPDTVCFEDIRGDVPISYPDVVVHLAGLSNDPMGELDPKLTDSINRGGTARMLTRFPYARHVILSSCSVYGTTGDMATEEAPTRPLTAYARSKDLIDKLVEFTPRAISLRLGTVYGYSPGHRLDLVVNRMVHDALNTGSVTVTADAWRPLTHVEDVAATVTWAVSSTATGIFNVVGENIEVSRLAQLVGSFAGVTVLTDVNTADRRDYRASGAKLEAEGVTLQHTVEGSLPVLFERTAFLPAGHYTRLTTLKRLMERGDVDSALRRAA